MRTESVNRGPDLPAALSAFLRGAERRAFLFLWLQGGDAGAAERALAAAIRAFPGPAGQMPMAEWPTRFWTLLLALPPSMAQDPAGGWPPALAFLAEMPAPARRALLLRQIAGLDESTAAAILGLDLAGYQQALAQACPHDPTGGPDAAGWRRQAEAIQQAGRDLDDTRLQRLAQLREAALAGRGVSPPPATATATDARVPPGAADAPPGPRTRRPAAARGRWIVVAAVALALLLAALWWTKSPAPPPSASGVAANGSGSGDDLRVIDNEPVLVEPLPEADPPAQAADWPVALPEVPGDPVIAELALLSWYAAGSPASRIEREGGEVAAVASTATETGTADAVLATGAWAQLDAVGQAQVRAAAAAVQALDPAAQAQLRARFAALDAMERAGWLLGPALGADYAALQPLVGFVDEGEREPLLAVLRGLAPEQRRQLAELAARTPPAERATLRRALLATPPAQRGDWLAQRTRQ